MKTFCLVGATLALLANFPAQKRATDVFVMDGDNRIQMKYSLAETRGSHNVLAAKVYHTFERTKIRPPNQNQYATISFLQRPGRETQRNTYQTRCEI